MPDFYMEGRMNVEEIAKKICLSHYLQLDKSHATYSPEKYWETNKKYFLRRAEIYLEVKECLAQIKGDH